MFSRREAITQFRSIHTRVLFYFFFFFQAEDGIRDLTVTGVQTCALPISVAGCLVLPWRGALAGVALGGTLLAATLAFGSARLAEAPGGPGEVTVAIMQRSEERRVGKSVDLGGRRIIKKKKKKKERGKEEK